MMQYKLQENENVLLELQPESKAGWYWITSWVSRFIHFFIILFIVAIFNFFFTPHRQEMVFVWDAIKASLGIANHGFILIAGIIILIFLILFVLSRLLVKAYHYTITNQRIIIKYGLISLNQRIIPLSQVNDVNMQSSMIERPFGLGSVYLDTLTTALSFNRYRKNANNTCRLDGLTYTQCDEAMNTISAHIQKLRANQSV